MTINIKFCTSPHLILITLKKFSQIHSFMSRAFSSSAWQKFKFTIKTISISIKIIFASRTKWFTSAQMHKKVSYQTVSKHQSWQTSTFLMPQMRRLTNICSTLSNGLTKSASPRTSSNKSCKISRAYLRCPGYTISRTQYSLRTSWSRSLVLTIRWGIIWRQSIYMIGRRQL